MRALHVPTPRGLTDTCRLHSSSHILRDALTMTKPVRARQLVCPARNVAESVRKQEFGAKYSRALNTMTAPMYDGMRVSFPSAT
jgi:hypothetical protein